MKVYICLPKNGVKKKSYLEFCLEEEKKIRRLYPDLTCVFGGESKLERISKLISCDLIYCPVSPSLCELVRFEIRTSYYLGIGKLVL
jgi:hypothetical protein